MITLPDLSAEINSLKKVSEIFGGKYEDLFNDVKNLLESEYPTVELQRYHRIATCTKFQAQLNEIRAEISFLIIKISNEKRQRENQLYDSDALGALFKSRDERISYMVDQDHVYRDLTMKVDIALTVRDYVSSQISHLGTAIYAMRNLSL